MCLLWFMEGWFEVRYAFPCRTNSFKRVVELRDLQHPLAQKSPSLSRVPLPTAVP